MFAATVLKFVLSGWRHQLLEIVNNCRISWNPFVQIFFLGEKNK